MKTKTLVSLSAVLLFSALFSPSMLSADSLHLVNGRVIDGTFLGGDARQIKFLEADGSVSSYAVTDVASISFQTGATTAVAPIAPAAPVAPAAPARPRRAVQASAPAPAPAPAATIPSGSIITVRTIDSIDSDITDEGERFRASIDDPIVVDGRVVIPRGADATLQVVRVEQSGKLSGSDEVSLKLFDVTVNGRAYDVASNYAEVKSESKGRQTAKRTAVATGVGAVLGGIFGGGKGAAIGAGAGAGTAVLVQMTRGKNVRIPSETRLDFVLRAPLPLN